MHNWTEQQVRGITKRIEHNQTIPMFDQLIKIGISPKYAKFAVDKYETTPKEIFNFNESIFLTGKSGAGKTITSIMWIIFHFEQWRRNLDNWNPDKEAIFIKEIDILETIKNSYSKPNIIDDGNVFTASEIVIKNYKDVALLVIDDFGIDKTSDWSYSMLYSILCYRYEWEKQTIFSSNYSLNEISKKLGDVRITNRIADWCRVIQMSGDFRKK